jgi:hypothetical protein
MFMSHRARFSVTPLMLDEGLQLPAGVHVIGAEWDRRQETIILEIEDSRASPELPDVAPCDEAPRIMPVLTRQQPLAWDFSRRVPQ